MPKISHNCPVCGERAQLYKDRGDYLEVSCERCTIFILAYEALRLVEGGVAPVGLVSGHLKQRFEVTGEATDFTYAELQKLLLKGYPSFAERVERYLIQFSTELKTLNGKRNARAANLMAAAYCGSESELDVIIEYLRQEKLLDILKFENDANLTPAGHIACDKLKTKRTSSSQGFVAMWFSNELEEAWKQGFEPAIEGAGYTPLRIDKKEHINDITDEILAEIRNSRFVVADLTGQRGGVYYEAGFGYGLDKPVFYTCKAGEEKEVHFDVRQLACIFWTDTDDLKKRLRARIEAVIGAGPKKAD